MTSPTAPPTAPLAAPPGVRPGRVPGLDGLRAIAAMAVVLFHALPGVLPGGFAAVDVFFVLSGYLITAGLLRERTETGRVRLLEFWRRRARRLLPALAVLVLVVGSCVLALRGDVAVGFGSQLLGTATFCLNWMLAASGNDYFASSAPPVLQNLWSLGVEEQFYLIWPVLLALVLLRPWPRRRVVVGTSVLAGASLLGMWALLAFGDSSRAYYGSDTHSFGLLAGAALAAQLHGRAVGIGGKAAGRVRAQLLTIAALVALAGVFVFADGAQGIGMAAGTAAASAAGLVLILAIIRGGWIARVLSWAPLRAIGVRSYGIYLWHWPVIVIAWALIGGPPAALGAQLELAAAAIGVTAAAAWASYRFIERPVLSTGIRRSLLAAFRPVGPRGLRGMTAGLTALAVAVAVAATGTAAATAPAQSAAAVRVAAGQRAIEQARRAPAAATTQIPSTTQSPGPTPSSPPTSSPPAAPAPAATTPPPAPAPAAPPAPPTGTVPSGSQITAIGDSVMLASAPALLARFPGIDIDAVVSRQARLGPDIVTQLAAQGRLRPIVVVGLGTNGYLGTGTLDKLLAAVGPERRLVLVNVSAPREWAASDNTQMQQFAAAHPGVVVVDWQAAVASHPGILGPDSIHPGSAGGTVYAQTLAAALAG